MNEPVESISQGDTAPVQLSATESSTSGPAGAGSGRPALALPLMIYTLVRLGLVVVLTAILVFFMPFIVALLFAVIVQLPLAWILFANQRRKVNEVIAARNAVRRTEREKLRRALSGE